MKDTVGECRLCGAQAKLVKAHIIPRSFYAIPAQETGEVLKIVTNIPGYHPTTSRQGVYDPAILCEKCEPKFSDVDSYAAELLLRSIETFTAWGFGGATWYYTVPKFRYSLLKRFFLSVLWRAAVSSVPIFDRVKLTKEVEVRLRNMIVSENAGQGDDFAVNLSLYDDEPAAAMMMSPVPRVLEGTNCIRFKLNRYTAFIKLDEKPHSPILREFQLSPFSPLIIVRDEWRASADFRAARKMVLELQSRGIRVF